MYRVWYILDLIFTLSLERINQFQNSYARYWHVDVRCCWVSMWMLSREIVQVLHNRPVCLVCQVRKMAWKNAHCINILIYQDDDESITTICFMYKWEYDWVLLGILLLAMDIFAKALRNFRKIAVLILLNQILTRLL